MNVTKDIGIYYLGKRIKTEIVETQVKVGLKWQSMAGLFYNVEGFFSSRF